MDVIIMPSISLLIHKVVADYPQFTFTAGDTNRWHPQKKAIYYTEDDAKLLLHELAHALLDHSDYKRDLELLAIERDAWAYAKEQLAPQYDTMISQDDIDTSLDSYRDWLHARSTCPSCAATGIQSQASTYRCLACHTIWRVNEARICALRRYTIVSN